MSMHLAALSPYNRCTLTYKLNSIISSLPYRSILLVSCQGSIIMISRQCSLGKKLHSVALSGEHFEFNWRPKQCQSVWMSKAAAGFASRARGEAEGRFYLACVHLLWAWVVTGRPRSKGTFRSGPVGGLLTATSQPEDLPSSAFPLLHPLPQPQFIWTKF